MSPQEIAAYLDAPYIAVVATVNRNGTPHLTPNGYRYDGKILTLIARTDRLKYLNLQRDHGDGYEMAPGVTVLRTPGHTEEDASLMVETAEGFYVLTHLWWLADMTPEQDPLAWNQARLEASRNKMVTVADWIIPGHGPMFKNPRQGSPLSGLV